MEIGLKSVERARQICVLGMHRSGTSMVTRMLHDCGMYLGEEGDLLPPSAEDNREGYWENNRFVEINNGILALFGGTWDVPPSLPDGWISDPRLRGFRSRAQSLVEELSDHGTWGWKDPRTCITLEFWKDLVPNLEIVLCVRHPLEVAQSLTVREVGYVSRDRALALWYDSYELALSTCGETPMVVTHYITYFYEAAEELRRVLDAVGSHPTEDQLSRATSHVHRDLWRGVRVDDAELARQAPANLRALYEQLRLMGGPVLAKLRQDEEFQTHLNKIALQQSLRRIERLEELNIKRAEEIARLTGQLNRVHRIQRLLGPKSSMHERLTELRDMWASLARRVAR